MAKSFIRVKFFALLKRPWEVFRPGPVYVAGAIKGKGFNEEVA